MTPPRPMLAASVRALPTHAEFDRRFATEWTLEEKLDGHRCLVRVGPDDIEAFSRPQPGRGGVALTRAIPPDMAVVLRTLPRGDYDGELVATTGKAWDVTRKTSHTIFVAFDLLRIADLDLMPAPYSIRRATLIDALRYLPPGQNRVSTVTTHTPRWSDVEAIWLRGGEGAIVKRLSSTYTPGLRSADWLKVKAVHTATLTIVGYEAGKSGPYSALRLRDERGVETTVKTPDHATLRAITAKPEAFLGRQVVIEFQERTPSGLPRHGRFDHFAAPAEVIAFPTPATRTR